MQVASIADNKHHYEFNPRNILPVFILSKIGKYALYKILLAANSWIWLERAPLW